MRPNGSCWSCWRCPTPLSGSFKAPGEQGDQLDPAAKRWINSFRTVDRLLGRAMRNQGVVEIQTLDQMFDPTWHTAVEVIEDPDAPEGSIHRVQRKGYVWKNLVLRKTEAVVVKNEENA